MSKCPHCGEETTISPEETKQLRKIGDLMKRAVKVTKRKRITRKP